MLIATLILAALIPFAFIAFLYREADVDSRQALFSIAAVSSVVLVVAVLLLLEV